MLHDHGLAFEETTVNLHLQENLQPDFLAVNRNGTVPVLDDEGFVLTEGSAILKYLARKHRLPAYPDDSQAQARVDEMLSWFEINFRAWVTLADFVEFDYSPYPHVVAWIARMRARPGWDSAFAGFGGLATAARLQRRAASA